MKSRYGSFPVDLIGTDAKVLCLFASYFGGKNDVMHLHGAGHRNVTIVDWDVSSLHNLAQRTGYAPIAMDIVRDYKQISRSEYDVVVSDQYSNYHGWANKVLAGYFRRGSARVLIIGAGVDERRRYRMDKYIERSDHLGGQYWRIIRVKYKQKQQHDKSNRTNGNDQWAQFVPGCFDQEPDPSG